jgi:hypothetical protein
VYTEIDEIADNSDYDNTLLKVLYTEVDERADNPAGATGNTTAVNPAPEASNDDDNDDSSLGVFDDRADVNPLEGGAYENEAALLHSEVGERADNPYDATGSTTARAPGASNDDDHAYTALGERADNSDNDNTVLKVPFTEVDERADNSDNDNTLVKVLH